MTLQSDESVLVVAFDGLDYELIEKFNLQNITQEEFGKINNSEGISSIKTSELFTSFITGKTFEEHGVKGLKKKDLPAKILPQFIVSNIRGMHTLREILRSILKTEPTYPNKDTLDTSTIFDEINNSKAMYVPGYNPSPYWQKIGAGTKLRVRSVEDRDFGYYWDNHEHLRRRKELFREVNKYYDFCMVHIFRPDQHQHLYGDPNLETYNEDKLKELYLEIDELAGEIKEFFSDEFDRIVFMSDHGLPTEDEHNENAFYSCNRELFGNQVPKITDFFYKFTDEKPVRKSAGVIES